MRITILLLLLAIAPAARPGQLGRLSRGESLAGGALRSDGRVLTWGDNLREWSLPSLDSHVLTGGPFGEGGCLADLDRDGRQEFVAVLGKGLGKLIRTGPPHWKAELIDTEVEMHDCIEAELFGRRGVLMIQRGAQVRFYERSVAGAWSSRDIYSIYTPSYQGGLALADVDGDGRTDIFCGNYWIQSPERFELPWRLFAINTWTETERSATFRVVPLGLSRVAAAQAHMAPARLAIFEKPADPKQQWPARELARDLRPSNVHGLAEWKGKLLAGERNGAASRLISIDPQTGRGEVVNTGDEIVSILATHAGAVIVRSSGVEILDQPSRR